MEETVSFKAFDMLQMDIYVLDKYSKSNKGNGYIFALVDVFSSKAYATKFLKEPPNH